MTVACWFRCTQAVEGEVEVVDEEERASSIRVNT
jgi:hypothetical protein